MKFSKNKQWFRLDNLSIGKGTDSKAELTPLSEDIKFEVKPEPDDEGISLSDLNGCLSVTFTWTFDEKRPHTLPYAWKRKQE